MFTRARITNLKAGPDDGLREGEFRGYASVFNVVDSYGDVVRPGAFAETLADWASKDLALPLLFGHNMRDPDFNIGHIVTASEDEHGLLVHGRVDLEGPKGPQVYRLLKGRRVGEMSFAYDVLEGGPAKNEVFGDFYELLKLKLFEVSIVPIGANPQTEILAVKHLAAAVKAGRVLSAANEDMLRSAREAIDAVLKSVESSEEPKGSPTTDPQPTGLGTDQEKASDTRPSPGEPDGAAPGKASAESSVDDWARKLRLLEGGNHVHDAS